MTKENSEWVSLNKAVISCNKCPRLVAWREKIAREKRRAFRDFDYWGKPVPGFGDRNARVMILGLAPGAHGSNRTGRMFTGDASGDFLYPALYREGFASQPAANDNDDGLKLKILYITAVCRCVPPGNKPTRDEQRNCLSFLNREIDLLASLEGIVALGGIAFTNAIDLIKEKYGAIVSPRPKFSHNALFSFNKSPLWLLASYHPSRQNTQTGRLTEDMFSAIWQRVSNLIDKDFEGIG